MPVETSLPITFDQLVALWKSATDEGYHRSFFEIEDSGIEVHAQAWEQFARASIMVNRTTQAMFILPWSGQSDEPASGARNATVTLRFERVRRFEYEITIEAGTVIEHVTTDFGTDGAVEVTTGRRYLLSSRVVFLPGQAGPLFVEAVAERPGYGYNLPLPNTINRIQQYGAGATNDGARVITPATLRQAQGFGDVMTSATVGQYVEFTAGANTGQVRRVLAFNPPGAGDLHGGDLILDRDWIFTGSIVGTFQVGERVTQAASSSTAAFLGVSGDRVVLEDAVGVFVTGSPIVGDVSGASFTPSVIERSGILTAELNATWRVLPWDSLDDLDLGISVTNEESPDGGRSPMLDELGGERAVYRAPNESDESYRLRVATPADVVCPNAIVRSLNTILVPLGLSACFREVGTELFPGAFFDAGSSLDVPQDPQTNFAFDLDFTLRPEDRFKLDLSLAEFRGFFLVGVPPLGLGEFGVPFDETGDGVNAPDAIAPALNFFDGFPAGNLAIYGAIFNAIDRTRAGGVGFDLYVEDQECI